MAIRAALGRNRPPRESGLLCAVLSSKRPSAGSVRGRPARRRRRNRSRPSYCEPAGRDTAAQILSGGLAAGLVLALGLAAWAWRERGIAIDERRLAQRNFDAAKSTVDFASSISLRD